LRRDIARLREKQGGSAQELTRGLQITRPTKPAHRPSNQKLLGSFPEALSYTRSQDTSHYGSPSAGTTDALTKIRNIYRTEKFLIHGTSKHQFRPHPPIGLETPMIPLLFYHRFQLMSGRNLHPRQYVPQLNDSKRCPPPRTLSSSPSSVP